MTVMVHIPDGFDPSTASFGALLNLSHRIPGYMSRSVPGKLWIRIGRDLMRKGFTLLSLGQCLAYSFREAVPGLQGIEILLAADDERLIREFTDIHARARIISGRNRKLALEADGTLSCDDLDCTTCEEKKDCDTIRDIIKKRKKQRMEKNHMNA
jgi:CO dehydrogenase/acetyl-CoA synthase beta subunit